MAKQEEKNQKFELKQLDANNIVELDGWKAKQETLLKENPFVAIEDNSTYEVAKKTRTNLVSGRTEIQKQDKLIGSVVSKFRKGTKAIAEELISITIEAEQKQQEEVSRFERIIEEKRLEKERAEEARIEKIKNTIDVFNVEANILINGMTYETIAKVKGELDELFIGNNEFDFEEFDFTYQDAKTQIQGQFDTVHAQLEATEQDRLQREKLEAENKRQDEELKKLREERELQDKINKQRNHINETRETMLDRIFQMSFDNYSEETNSIKKDLAVVNEYDASLSSEFESMKKTLDRSLAQKLEQISQELKRKQEEERVAKEKAQEEQRLADEAEKKRLQEIERVFSERRGFLDARGYSYDGERFFNSEINHYVKEDFVSGANEEMWKAGQEEVQDQIKKFNDAKAENIARQERLAPEKKALIDFLKSRQKQVIEQIGEYSEEMNPLIDEITEGLEGFIGASIIKTEQF